VAEGVSSAFMDATRVEFVILEVDTDTNGTRDIALLWGKTREGESVCCIVDPESYYTSFYFPAPACLADGTPFGIQVGSLRLLWSVLVIYVSLAWLL
jgi:hypothetical protein